MTREVDAAVAALKRGEIVVYPTETVYGLGGSALDPRAIRRVFALKRRSRDQPLSIAFPNRDSIENYCHSTPVTRAFMDEFLPGPVTILLRRKDSVPSELTAGADMVGVRVPDHPLARELLTGFSPITATSANISGGVNTNRVEDLPDDIRRHVSVIIDGGTTLGGESTVVDPEQGTIIRRGRCADAVDEWLHDNLDGANEVDSKG